MLKKDSTYVNGKEPDNRFIKDETEGTNWNEVSELSKGDIEHNKLSFGLIKFFGTGGHPGTSKESWEAELEFKKKQEKKLWYLPYSDNYFTYSKLTRERVKELIAFLYKEDTKK